MINSAQSVYNSHAHYENQPSVGKPEVHRYSKSSHLARLNVEQNSEQAATMDGGSLPVSLQQVKNLSFYFNTFRAYMNQMEYLSGCFRK
jgi:hypothetical protein